MNDFLVNLISNPFYAIITFLLLWQILVFVLIKKCTLKPKTWAKFEYAWVGIGFIAVLALIAENRLTIQNNELNKLEIWIQRDFNEIKGYAKLQSNCRQLNFIGTLNKADFDEIQLRQNKICEWTKKVVMHIDSLSNAGYPEITNLPNLQVDREDSLNIYSQIRSEIDSANELIAERDTLRESISRNEWDEFRRTFGIVLLIIAFSLRFTITSHKVKQEA